MLLALMLTQPPPAALLTPVLVLAVLLCVGMRGDEDAGGKEVVLHSRLDFGRVCVCIPYETEEAGDCRCVYSYLSPTHTPLSHEPRRIGNHRIRGI